MRRLKQIAVVEADEGQALAVGQRLVTREGQMRRWDGFVAEGAGAAAAERLFAPTGSLSWAASFQILPKRSNCGAESSATRRFGTMERCREAPNRRGMRRSRPSGTRATRTRAIDAAAAALERIEAQRSGLAQRQVDLEPVLEAAGEAVTAAERSLAALPDPAALEQELERSEATRRSAAAAVADKRAEAATRARESASRSRALSAAGARAGRMAQAPRDAEERLAQALERQKQQAAERAELERSRRSSTRDCQLERANDESQVRIGEAASAERDAEEAVVEAAQAVSEANERSADTRERRAAAAARAEAQQARSADSREPASRNSNAFRSGCPRSWVSMPTSRAIADEQAATLDRLTPSASASARSTSSPSRSSPNSTRRGPRAPRKPRS